MSAHDTIPRLGFGTYGRTGDAGVAAMLFALETGYRHLDTAQDYNTEKQVGAALQRSELSRDEVFVTTKVSTQNYAKGALLPSLEQSRDNLGVEQIDLTLLHWPAPNGEYPLAQYLEPLIEAQERGMTRLIGVSNFTIALLEEAFDILGGKPLATNQVELHPFLQNRKLAGYCGQKDILVTCYQPIAHGGVTGDEVLEAIARAHEATAAQVALAWELAKGYAAIPTSSKNERIAENFGALKITLSEDEMAQIDALDRGERHIDPAWGPDWD